MYKKNHHAENELKHLHLQKEKYLAFQINVKDVSMQMNMILCILV